MDDAPSAWGIGRVPREGLSKTKSGGKTAAWEEISEEGGQGGKKRNRSKRKKLKIITP